MCLCVLLYKQVPGYPLVMAANREEYYDRPSQPPSWVARDPAVFAGRDERSGGTWQGANQFGLLLALTNRVSSGFDPQRRSRGLLCTPQGQPMAEPSPAPRASPKDQPTAGLSPAPRASQFPRSHTPSETNTVPTSRAPLPRTGKG